MVGQAFFISDNKDRKYLYTLNYYFYFCKSLRYWVFVWILMRLPVLNVELKENIYSDEYILQLAERLS